MASLIEGQIDDWEKRGVIDPATAMRLRADIGPKIAAKARATRRFSFFQVVAFFAALSIGAALLIFIASNWEAVPRLGRVGMVVAAIFAGFIAGAIVHRGQGLRLLMVEEACYLVSGAAFMGGVALVAQMYHISGDARQAAMLYTVALGLSGFAVRSRALVAIAAAWITWWQLDGPDGKTILSMQYLIFFAVVAVGIAFATWIRAPWLRRLLYIALVVGVLPYAADVFDDVLRIIVDHYFDIPREVRRLIWAAAWAAALALMVANRFAPMALDVLFISPRKRAGLFFGLGVVSIAFLHAELSGNEGVILAAIAAVIFVLVALYAYGRDHFGIRYVSYALFAGEVLNVYRITVYSMIGTAGFFLALGVMLAVLAVAVYQLEKRWKRRRREAVNA